MTFFKTVILLAAVHFLLVATFFLFFGLGLEGERNLGHELLWILLQPGANLPGPYLIILSINSLAWGTALTTTLNIFRFFRR